MKMRRFFPYTIYAAAFSLVFLFSACGSDEAAPSIDTSTIPHTVFFNDTGSDEFFLFTGRAADNTNVDDVQVSIDNGSTWDAAEIDNDPPNRLWNVEWSYLASSADMPAGIYTILVRAADRDGNETTSSPVILEATSGSNVGQLQAVFSAAVEGDYIGLSTGEGDAYGDSVTALTIPIDVGLTVQGSGYGDMLTSGGHSPEGDSVATLLETDPATARLFSIDADLTVRNLRLLGAVHGIYLSDDGGPDPVLSIEDCLFDRQSGWAVFAEDDDGAVNVELLSCIVDASQADSTGSAGGLYLDNLNYMITESEFYNQSAEGAGAGVLINEGAGTIDASLFEENSLAIWASGGLPVITSCTISGAATTTNGINLTGGPGEALIRRNTIDGNTGFGLRVAGEMDLVLRNNAVTDNGLSGVLIDSDLDNPSLININMGTSTDRGNNLLDDNEHPDGISGFETQVYVTDDTQAGSTYIPANWNYWGYATATEVDFAGVDNGENGGNRATLGIGNFWATLNSEVGP